MTSYVDDHADALVAIGDAGAQVTFTLPGQGAYNAATDTTTPGPDVVVTGAAVEVKGSLFKYQQLGLVVEQARTLFFTPTTLGQSPPLTSRVTWGGIVHTVKYVAPIAPAGDVLAATVVIST